MCLYLYVYMYVCVCVCVGFCAKDRLRTGAESVFLQNSILVCPAVTHFHLLLLCTLLPLCTHTHTHTQLMGMYSFCLRKPNYNYFRLTHP